jgi:hypothetical protein
MAFEDVVKIVNKNLRDEREDAIRHRENPRIIRILDQLVMLSDDPDTQTETLKAIPVCPHENIGINGICKACEKQVFALKA